MNKQNRHRVEEAFRSMRTIEPRTAQDLKHALGVNKSVRLKQGQVTELSRTDSTCSVLFPGSTDSVAGVPYFDMLPVPNKGCWVATDGEDLFVTSIGKGAPGSGSIRVGKSSSQTITSQTSPQTAIIWSAPMTAGGVPQNSGWDWYGYGYNTALGSSSWYIGWNSAQTTRLYLPAPGVWRFTAQAVFAAGGTTTRRELAVELTGTTELGQQVIWPTSNTVGPLNLVTEARLSSVSSGEYVRALVIQNSGGDLTVNSNAYSPSLHAEWLGPAGEDG